MPVLKKWDDIKRSLLRIIYDVLRNDVDVPMPDAWFDLLYNYKIDQRTITFFSEYGMETGKQEHYVEIGDYPDVKEVNVSIVLYKDWGDVFADSLRLLPIAKLGLDNISDLIGKAVSSRITETIAGEPINLKSLDINFFTPNKSIVFSHIKNPVILNIFFEFDLIE